jgi:hypothetical protein
MKEELIILEIIKTQEVANFETYYFFSKL